MPPNADFSSESESAVEGGKITLKLIPTFFDLRSEKPESPMKQLVKSAKLDEGTSIVSEKSGRVRIRVRPLYQFLICSRIAPTINRASR